MLTDEVRSLQTNKSQARGKLYLSIQSSSVEEQEHNEELL